MKTTERKYIQKLEELIELWKFYADDILSEDYLRIKRLESELSSLKAEMEKEYVCPKCGNTGRVEGDLSEPDKECTCMQEPPKEVIDDIKDINFIKWYSGMDEVKIRNAYKRYIQESKTQ